MEISFCFFDAKKKKENNSNFVYNFFFLPFHGSHLKEKEKPKKKQTSVFSNVQLFLILLLMFVGYRKFFSHFLSLQLNPHFFGI
jgi:hypothetical protein